MGFDEPRPRACLVRGAAIFPVLPQFGMYGSSGWASVMVFPLRTRKPLRISHGNGLRINSDALLDR